MTSTDRVLPETLRGTKVLVVGLARSGAAAVDLLVRSGARVTAVDDDPDMAGGVDTARWRSRGVTVHVGSLDRGGMARPDIVVVSPGVPPTSSWMRWADDHGIPIVAEIECASWVTKAGIAAITGTNGKSTTTELLGSVVRAWGRPVEVAGNIGRALSGVADRVPADGWIVTEVSSFQLETVHRFRPRVAIHLNLTPDHLDRYGSMDLYRRAKERLFENQAAEDAAVLNSDDPVVWSARERIRSKILATSVRGPVEEGAWAEEGRMVARIGGERRDVIETAALGIRGPHNLSNALAAVAAAVWMGVPEDALARALRTFRGLSHRMESVGKVQGVEFVNDSKATNVEAVLHALSSFSVPVMLIAGGLGKGQDFAPLAEAARGRVRRAVLFGESRDEIGQVLNSVAEVEFATSMREAVQRSFEAAESGDAVLLSPACASFDMFENFEDRGEAFKAEIRKLEEEVA